MESPENLIAAMSTIELQELLNELGIDASESQAIAIQGLVRQLGSLDAVLDLIGGLSSESCRAA